jgi:uncharacterized membrane protein YgcG
MNKKERRKLKFVQELNKLPPSYIGQRYLKKGIKVTKTTIQFGYDGDDFVRNLMTCIIDETLIKIPRFINRYHYKKNHFMSMYRCISSFKTRDGLLYLYGNKITGTIYHTMLNSERQNFVRISEDEPQRKNEDENFEIPSSYSLGLPMIDFDSSDSSQSNYDTSSSDTNNSNDFDYGGGDSGGAGSSGDWDSNDNT